MYHPTIIHCAVWDALLNSPQVNNLNVYTPFHNSHFILVKSNTVECGRCLVVSVCLPLMWTFEVFTFLDVAQHGLVTGSQLPTCAVSTFQKSEYLNYTMVAAWNLTSRSFLFCSVTLIHDCLGNSLAPVPTTHDELNDKGVFTTHCLICY